MTNPTSDTPRLIKVTGWGFRMGKTHGFRGQLQQLRSKYVRWEVWVGNRFISQSSSERAGLRELARMTPEKVASNYIQSKAEGRPSDEFPWERYDLGSASGKVVAWYKPASRPNPTRRRNPIVVETPTERQRRLRLKYTEIVEIDASRFKALFEQHRREKLAWSSSRSEAATGRPTFNGYPIVYVDPDRLTVDVEDGRHRINEAARRGVPIQVTCQRGCGRLLAELGLVTTRRNPGDAGRMKVSAYKGMIFVRNQVGWLHGRYGSVRGVLKQWNVADYIPHAMEDVVSATKLKPIAYITEICVQNGRKGEGVGREVLTTAIDRFRELGVKTIFLTATPYDDDMMPNLLRFYDRFGFKEVARADSGDWVGMELKL